MIGANHRGFEAFPIFPRRPPHRERNRSRCRRSSTQSCYHVLSLVFARVAENHQKFVSADPHHCFFCSHMPHEKSRHLHQHGVAFSMSVRVVVLLEVVDVEIDASPFTFRLGLTLTRDGVQVPAVVTTSKWVADAKLEELRLQFFSMRDVHENSVTVLVTSFRIDRQKCAVDYRPRLTVTPRELKLDIANGSLALELCHFSRSHLWSHKIAGAITLQLLQRLDPEHLEERRIGVDDLPVQRRNVNSLFQALRQ